MRYIFVIAFLFCSYIAHGQNAPAPTAPAPVAPVLAPMPAPVVAPVTPVITPTLPAVTKTVPSAPVSGVAATVPAGTVPPAPVAPVTPVITPTVPAGTETAPSAPAPAIPTTTPAETVPPAAGSTGMATVASAETNAPPAPAKDPAKCVIARLSFDNSLQPDVGGTTIPVTFKRESAAYLEGAPVSENSPRFVEGRFGKALLLEAGYENIFSIAQSSASDAAAFLPVQGSALAITAEQPWQGNEALSVATKGENSEEGFSVETAVEKAFYTKEVSAIVPVYYVASLYLKGQGNLKLTLKDVESGKTSEPVYVDLSADWKRFHCFFGYQFNRVNISTNQAQDWKKSVTNNISAKLQLICTTVDSSKMNFFADGFQLEKRYFSSGKSAEISPHSWVLGAFQTAQEQLAIDVKNDYFNSWKKTGSIAFWFKPLWEARDRSGEFILQIARQQLNLVHDGGKISFFPAGVSFAPYDWKNNWHHVVITWNEAGERALYVDGMDYPNAGGEMRPIKNPDSIMAGDFVKNLSPDGALDELMLYNTTLTADQAKALYSAAPALQPAATPGTVEAPATAPAATTTPSTTVPATGAVVTTATNASATTGKQATGSDSEKEEQ